MRFLPLILLGAVAFMYVSRPVTGLSTAEAQHNLEEESRIISELQSEVDNEEASNNNAVTSPAMEMADAALLEIGAISATEVEKGGKGGKSGGASKAGGAKAGSKKSGAKKGGAKKSGKKGKKAGKKNGRNASKKARKSGRKARKSKKSRKPKRIASRKKRSLSQHRQRARKAKLKAFKAMKKMKKWAKTAGKKLSKAARKAKLAAKRKMLKALGKLKRQYERRRLRKMQAKADALVAQQRKDAAKLKKAMAVPGWKPFVPKGYKAPKRRVAKRKTHKKKISLSKLKKQIKNKLKKKLNKLKKKKTLRREARKQKKWAKKQAKKLKKAAKKAAKRKALRTAQKLKSLFGKQKERQALQKSAENVGKVYVPKKAPGAKKKPARKMRTILPAAKPKIQRSAAPKNIKKCKKKSVIQLLKAKLAENKKKAMHLHHQLVKYQKFGTRKMRWGIEEDGTGSGLHVPPNVPKKDKQALKDYEKMMKNVETLHLLGANKWSIAEADIKKGHVLTNLADAQRERLRDFDQEQQAEMLTPEGWASGEIEPDVYNEFEPIH